MTTVASNTEKFVEKAMEGLSEKTMTEMAKNKVNVNADMLSMPLAELMSPKRITLPGKVFFVFFMIVFVLELVIEARFYFKNKDAYMRNHLAFGFWMRYAAAAALAIFALAVYMVIIHSLYWSGMRKMSWLMVLVPLLYFGGMAMHAKITQSITTMIKAEGARAWFQRNFVRVIVPPSNVN